MWGKNDADGVLDFWQKFRSAEPTHPLWQQLCSKHMLQRTVPLSLHGDEGVGLQEVPTLVLSWRCVLSAETSTWRSRFVIAILPARRRCEDTLQQLLAEVARSFKVLFDRTCLPPSFGDTARLQHPMRCAESVPRFTVQSPTHFATGGGLLIEVCGVF